MNSLLNAIICKVQKTLDCENKSSDCVIILNITRNLQNSANGQLKLILMTYSIEQIIASFGG